MEISEIETFAQMAGFLEHHKEIEWRIGKGNTLQGNYRERGKRCRVVLFYSEEELKLLHMGGNRFSRSILFIIYSFGIKIFAGKEELTSFSGTADSIGGIEHIGECLKGDKFFSRKDFILLWDKIMRMAILEPGEEAIFLGGR